MNLAEASRQYQDTLEAERSARSRFAGAQSMLDCLEAAEDETSRAAQVLWSCWFAGIPTAEKG